MPSIGYSPTGSSCDTATRSRPRAPRALAPPPRCSLGDPELGVAARISRPGLNFLFKSKPDLFAAAVRRALEQDLRTAACSLGDEVRPLQERLLEAFDT